MGYISFSLSTILLDTHILSPREEQTQKMLFDHLFSNYSAILAVMYK